MVLLVPKLDHNASYLSKSEDTYKIMEIPRSPKQAVNEIKVVYFHQPAVALVISDFTVFFFGPIALCSRSEAAPWGKTKKEIVYGCGSSSVSLLPVVCWSVSGCSKASIASRNRVLDFRQGYFALSYSFPSTFYLSPLPSFPTSLISFLSFYFLFLNFSFPFLPLSFPFPTTIILFLLPFPLTVSFSHLIFSQFYFPFLSFLYFIFTW